MSRLHNNLPQATLKNRGRNRERIELLRSRVNLLTGEDKLLMKMYLDNSNSFRQMARLAGVSSTSIARRINGITRRLIDGRYILCLRNSDRFTAVEMSIAREYFLLGLSIKTIAARRRWSYYRAHRIIKRIRQFLKDDSQQNRI